ncbi:hypothetical protein [Hyphomonas jannaschiana]|uniref:Uncharacterized protein n=1 Tax=Hyphomonas jannaschiana VP2 TaxID=1280952 RepID=A0A059F6C9_9PROT|nr:hypothetical protein [Hyphomonas jannaschiana]KCZ83910.1 hypothetical protein HJA_16510 [Hyphomonas jannaschiana VP2]
MNDLDQVLRLRASPLEHSIVWLGDKEAFLGFVIANTFFHARAIFQEQADVRYAPHLADLLIRQFSDAEFTGIVRAVVKLGFLDKRTWEPFDEFRAFVSQHLAKLSLAEVTKRDR